MVYELFLSPSTASTGSGFKEKNPQHYFTRAEASTSCPPSTLKAMLCGEATDFLNNAFKPVLPTIYLTCRVPFHSGCLPHLPLTRLTMLFPDYRLSVPSRTKRPAPRVALSHLYLKDEPLLRKTALAFGLGWSKSLKKV